MALDLVNIPGQITDDNVIAFDNLDWPSAVSLALTPATVTVTPVALARTVGAVSLASSPATVTVTPVTLGRTLGGVSRALSPPSITVTPQAFGTTPGAVSLALTPATVTVTPVVFGITASAAPTTEVLTPGSLNRRGAYQPLPDLLDDEEILILAMT
jgi:hypothetical protein